MKSLADRAISRWITWIATGELPRNARTAMLDVARISYDNREREIYSYGRHFPLVRFIPGTRKRPAVFLINGDRWRGGGWSATGRHQESVRTAVAETVAYMNSCGKRATSLIVPFSALNGAGIRLDSIRPVDVRNDRVEEITHRTRHFTDIPRWMRTKTVYDEKTTTVDAIRNHGAPGSSHRTWHGSRFSPYLTLSGHGYFNPADGEFQEYNGNRVRVDFGAANARVHPLTDDRVWAPWTLVGDENGRVTYRVARDVPAYEPDADGVYTWTEDRHWLGDALFDAEIDITTHVRERVPDDVRGWMETQEGYVSVTHSSRSGGNYVTREIHTRGKRFRFVSSFDYSEPAPLYFLCALPHGCQASTVEDAIAALMPDSVRAAMDAGRDVIRQGDIFAVATDLPRAEILARATRTARRSHAVNGRGAIRPGEDRDAIWIHGTRHTATEVAVTPDGVTYIRGAMYHDPARFDRNGNTRRDHVTRPLGDGDTWYVAIRNTVPRMPERARVRWITSETATA